MPRKTWFNIAQNKTDAKTADISIHAEIGYWGVSAKQFLEQLRLLGDGITTINLSIHSPGGEVLDGWAIYNALKMHPAKVVVTVKALAASMASVIMLAGDTIRIPKNAYVMIHRVSGGAYGDADQVKQMAEVIAKLEDGIVSAYAERSGLSEKEIRQMMDVETWLDGSEAVNKGFADELLASSKTTASATWRDHFAAAPRALFDTTAFTDPANHTEILDMKPEEIQKLITDGITAGLSAHAGSQKDVIGNLIKEGLKAEIPTAIKATIDESMKPITDRLDKVEAFGEDLKKITDRVDKAEKLVKAGIGGKAGGVTPVEGGEDDGDAGKDKVPANEKELNAALDKCKSHAERRDLVAAFDARKKK